MSSSSRPCSRGDGSRVCVGSIFGVGTLVANSELLIWNGVRRGVSGNESLLVATDSLLLSSLLYSSFFGLTVHSVFEDSKFIFHFEYDTSTPESVR